MKNPEKILVRAPNWIGDQVLAYPFFHYLRAAYPGSHITVSCVPWVQSVQFRNLVDSVRILPKIENHGFISKWKKLEASAEGLRENGPWDLGIILPHSLSSAWVMFRAGVKVRRGYRMDGRGMLLNQSLAADSIKNLHRSKAYLALVSPDIAEKNEHSLSDVLDAFDAAKAWTGERTLEPPDEPYWILAPGSNAESRRWSAQQFIELARLVLAETGLCGVIVGGAAESQIAQRIVQESSALLGAKLGAKFLDWTNRGSPASLWKLFNKAKFSVCNDSGLAHVASLCGSPVWIVWGAGNPSRTRPIGPGKTHLVLNPVECWPCERNSCTQPDHSKFACLKGIRAEAVWKEIKTEIWPK